MKKAEAKKKKDYSKRVSLYPLKWHEALGLVLTSGIKKKKKQSKIQG